MTFKNEQTRVKSIIRVAIRRNLLIRLTVVQIPVFGVTTNVFTGVYFKCKTVWADGHILFISCPTFEEAKKLHAYIRERKTLLNKVYAN